MKNNKSLNKFTERFGRPNASLSIMDYIMGGVGQTDEWIRVLREDPAIQSAEARLNDLEAEMDKDRAAAVDAAVCDLVGAHDTAAMLYGMRVMIAMYDAVQDPAAFSQHVLERIGEM